MRLAYICSPVATPPDDTLLSPASVSQVAPQTTGMDETQASWQAQATSYCGASAAVPAVLSPLASRKLTREDADAGHHLPHVDLARRFRRWARPEPRGSTGQTRARAPRLASRRRARQRRRRDGGRLAHAPTRRLRHGAEHVRADPRRVG